MMTLKRRRLPLNALRAFEAVARHGGFTAAANALLISQSALSRHVIALERLTGTSLFRRQPHSLTKAGERLFSVALPCFDRLQHVLDAIRAEQGCGRSAAVPVDTQSVVASLRVAQSRVHDL